MAWTISQGTTVIAAGTIDTRMPNAEPSFSALVPVGTGYTVSLTGTASNGAACSGSSKFDVIDAGSVAHVSLALVCLAPIVSASGSVEVQTVVSAESCPTLTAYAVSPTTQNVGQRIEVTGVTAADADGDTLTYSWTQSGGPGVLTIGNPATTTTPIVACSAAGAVTLVLAINDNHTPTGCILTQSFSINCL